MAQTTVRTVAEVMTEAKQNLSEGRNIDFTVRKKIGKIKNGFYANNNNGVLVTDGKLPPVPDTYKVKHVKDGSIVIKLGSLEGEELVTLHNGERAFIAWEELSDGKINCWVKGNANKTLELCSDGYYHDIPLPYKAEFPLKGNTPKLGGSNIKVDDKKIYCHTSWGDLEGAFGENIIICYGIDDKGNYDVNLLGLNTPSAADYSLVVNGELVGCSVVEFFNELLGR